jgi:hypothetical protein
MTQAHPTATQAPGAAALLVILGLLSALLLGGCARIMDRGAHDSPTPTEVEESETAEPEEVVEPDPPASTTSAMVDEALLHFSEGRYQAAATLLDRYLMGSNGAEPNEESARAIWGLAMLHLTPGSPTHDPSLGKSFLDRLEQELPGTTWSTQARWAQGLVAELERVQAEADEQERLLHQLTETVEQLRRIDLNRRPTGGAADTTRVGRDNHR